MLVVDDSPGIRQMFQTVLESWGYSVVTAASGPEALRQLDAATFHGMLLDYSMPGGMTGIDVLGRVHLYDPALPVVMITATHEIMGQALAAAKTCLLKPVELSELQQAVHHYFERSGDGRSMREEECPA